MPALALSMGQAQPRRASVQELLAGGLEGPRIGEAQPAVGVN